MLPRMSDESDPPQKDIPFTPVPVRARHDGWTGDRQRLFIRALQRIGSVGAAARSIGKASRSAYKLRERPGAESFAAAWDLALQMGTDNLRDHVIDRALHGAIVPRFHAGRQVGVAHRYYDRLAIAVLSGRGRSLVDYCREAEEAGARRAYFEIERAWQRDVQDLKETSKRLADAERVIADLTSTIRYLEELQAAPHPPHTPRTPRIRFL